MPLWGKRDSFAITGTVDVEEDSAAVVGSGTAFLSELDISDMVVIDSVKYKVAAITDDENLTLASVYAGSTDTGLTITGQDTPKYVPQADGRNVYGADTTEVGVAGNKAKGFNSPGWVNYTTYTAASGETRRKVETLVAMSSGYTAAVADDAEDSVLPNS